MQIGGIEPPGTGVTLHIAEVLALKRTGVTGYRLCGEASGKDKRRKKRRWADYLGRHSRRITDYLFVCLPVSIACGL
jgi:hypothetical protein